MKDKTEAELVAMVREGYSRLDEDERKRLARGVFAQNPQLFDQWVRECGPRLVTGWQRKTVASRKTADIARLLDQTLLKESNELLLAQIIQHYFVNVRPEMNDLFLQPLETGERGKDPAAAEASLAKVREQFAAQGTERLDFFEAALRWLAPEWFTPPPSPPSAELGEGVPHETEKG